MKNKKNIFIVILIILAIGLGVFYYFNKEKVIELEVVTSTLSEKENKIENKPGEELIQKEDLNNNNVTLNVLNKSYTVKIEQGKTVLDIMNILQKENDFSFSYKEYPSLGIFINEINNIKGERGKYWIYYVNDKEASVGASKYILKAGDIISWKLE